MHGNTPANSFDPGVTLRVRIAIAGAGRIRQSSRTAQLPLTCVALQQRG